jgi:hypothetical protein
MEMMFAANNASKRHKARDMSIPERKGGNHILPV